MSTPMPWPRILLRLIARWIDLLVVGLPFVLALMFAAGFSAPTLGALGKAMPMHLWQVLWVILLISLSPIPEAGLLSTWGTTPGKALAGLTVRDATGAKLTFETALRRGYRVAFHGLGLGLPVIAYVTQIVACAQVRRTGVAAWDHALGTDVRSEPPSVLQWAGLGAIAAAMIAVSVVTRRYTLG
jgi:hypothetical protein